MSEPDRRPRSLRGLTDDVLTLAPRARTARAYVRDGVDQLAGADPGLTQLRLALQAVLGIAVGVGLAFAFVKATGALQLPANAGPPAVVAAGDHALLIVAMLISAMLALMAGFTVTDATAAGQIRSTLILPFPMLGAMLVGIVLGPYRVLSLAWLVLLLGGSVYIRRFGPRGTAMGLVAFNGGFLGFFLHAELSLRDVGWLAALLGVGVAASLLVRFTLFRPDVVKTLLRMRRSWRARANRLLALSLNALEATDTGERRRALEKLGRQQVRLNECTLMIDAQLPASVPDTAAIEAQRLFDADLALSNIGRFAGALADRCTDAELRRRAQDVISAVLRGDAEAVAARAADLKATTCGDHRMTVVAHRMAGSAVRYIEARDQLAADLDRRLEDGPVAAFTPAVELNAGWLPGSGPISTEASTTPGRRALDRAVMPPYVRATIQVAVAATIAIVVGDIVSGQRLYWAVLATFLAFMATTNSGEQVRKALFRVGGTAIGIVIGDLLVHLTGGRIWASLLIVIVSLFFGIYLIRVNYTFMVIGITVTMSQLYAQLDEFSWHLLVLRLGETAIGVGAVALTVILVVPLRPQRVLSTGVLLWFRALSTLVEDAMARMLGGEPVDVRAKIRDLDAAYAALEATAAPLRQTMVGRNSAQLSEIRAVSSAARYYARSFATGVTVGTVPQSPALTAAVAEIRRSMTAIEDRVETGEHGTFTRSGSLLELAERALPDDAAHARLVLRDLMLIDAAMGRLAGALRMTITDHDASDDADETTGEPFDRLAASSQPGPS